MSQPVYLSDLLNPERQTTEAAIRLAKILAATDPRFHLNLGAMLQDECQGSKLNFQAITRILDILDAVVPSCVLLSLVRPVFRNGDLHLQSKCALLLGHHEHNLAWARKLLTD